MSTTSVDQILTIAAPARSAADASRTETGEGARFEDHLQRAANSEEATGEPQAKRSSDETDEVAVDSGPEEESDTRPTIAKGRSPFGHVRRTQCW